MGKKSQRGHKRHKIQIHADYGLGERGSWFQSTDRELQERLTERRWKAEESGQSSRILFFNDDIEHVRSKRSSAVHYRPLVAVSETQRRVGVIGSQICTGPRSLMIFPVVLMKLLRFQEGWRLQAGGCDRAGIDAGGTTSREVWELVGKRGEDGPEPSPKNCLTGSGRAGRQ